MCKVIPRASVLYNEENHSEENTFDTRILLWPEKIVSRELVAEK